MRSFSRIILVGLAAAACRSGSGLHGSSFAGASLLAPLSDAEEAHDGLLRADLARADSVARLGYVAGMSSVLANDALFLRGGLPVIRGRNAILAIASAESIGTATTVRWQPVRAEASVDGRSGYSYGYSVYSASQPVSPSLRIDRYIAFWRRDEAGWRIAAYAETYGAPPAVMAMPGDARFAVVPDIPMSPAQGALEAVRAADAEFSNDATARGTGEAFGRFAAEDAQVFSGPGEFISGPAAIRASFPSSSNGSTLAWHPIAGEVSKSGDLGFTVGNAVYTGKREDGAPQVGYSKYLTVWKKQRDGHWRYVVDGGSARPAQP